MSNENDSQSNEGNKEELAAMDPEPTPTDGVKAGEHGGKGGGPKAENDPVGDPDPDGGTALA